MLDPKPDYDFDNFQLLREEVSEESLNHPMDKYSSSLEYALQKKREGPRLHPNLLEILIDPNNQAASKVKITEQVLSLVVTNAVESLQKDADDFSLLKQVLPKVSPLLFNKKLCGINKKLIHNLGYDSTYALRQGDRSALDFFIDYYRIRRLRGEENMKVLDIFLSQDNCVQKQLNGNKEEVVRTVDLSIINPGYLGYLHDVLNKLQNQNQLAILHLPLFGLDNDKNIFQYVIEKKIKLF